MMARLIAPADCSVLRDHSRVITGRTPEPQAAGEDAVFGFRATGPALLINVSYFEKRTSKRTGRR
jgi:hypothetical protein